MVTGEVVGRETELAVLAEFLAAAEAWPRTLVLEREAGGGKTTLWQTAIEDARVEFRVLATRPLETEAKLAFAGVGDLLDGVHDTFGGLQEPQAQALRAALLLESPAAGSVDERAVALGFLGVLRLLATEQPVLIAVDDLQWLDLPSARVLAFAGTRLGEVRAGFLIALRAEERWRLAFAPERILPACTQLPIGGLTFDAIHQLLRARLGLVLSRPALPARARDCCGESLLRPRARPRRGCEANRSPARRDASRAADRSRARRSPCRRAAGGDAPCAAHRRGARRSQARPRQCRDRRRCRGHARSGRRG